MIGVGVAIPPWGSATAEQAGGPVVSKKAARQKMVEEGSKQRSFMFSASIPASRLLLGLQSRLSPMLYCDGDLEAKQTLSSPSCFGPEFSTATEKLEHEESRQTKEFSDPFPLRISIHTHRAC